MFMIELENVTRSFAETIAVDHLNLRVGRGEVVGFLGPNGAGKSTTMRMIAGVLAPDEGVIKILGQDVVSAPLAAKNLIGYLPENNPLYEDMLVRDYLWLTARLRGVSRNSEQIDEAIG